MLSLLTGLPGAGKTAWIVDRVLLPLAARDWMEEAITPDGEKVQVKRRLFTNINGLLLEHEKIDADDLLRWQEWVKPGDLIVFDEVQKPWPLTGANKEQPKCITELETHRHYGIDMWLLTQHPMLVNAAIARLAGQHMHVRKLGNSRLATVYEWDGVSRTLLYKNSFAKKGWRRSKAAEKAYKSSSLHTKQKRSLPTVLFIMLIALGFVGYMGPTVYARINERVHGTPPVASGAKEDKGVARDKGGTEAPKPASSASKPAEAPPVPSAAEKPVAFAGCARIRQRCQCFDSQANPVDKDASYCADATRVPTGHGSVLEALALPDTGRAYRDQLAAMHWADNDSNVLSFMARRELPSGKQAAVGGAAKRGE